MALSEAEGPQGEVPAPEGPEVRVDEHTDKTIRIALSRRNLTVLLAKLDGHPVEGARTIFYVISDGTTLFVTAEENAPHYANPERDWPLPGVMHPDSEEAIK